MNDKQFQSKMDREARKRTEALHEHLEDIGQKMARDQHAWLDKVMQDILPPKLYEAGKVGDMENEIHEYLSRHKFQVVWVPDSCSIKVIRDGNLHAEFKTELTLDGDPIDSSPTGPLQNN